MNVTGSGPCTTSNQQLSCAVHRLGAVRAGHCATVHPDSSMLRNYVLRCDPKFGLAPGQASANDVGPEVAMFRNRMPHGTRSSPRTRSTSWTPGWRRIVSEIGVQFAKPEAVELFRKAGPEGRRRRGLPRPGVRSRAGGQAPREFDVQARNPANNVHIGGDQMVFSAVYGSPFVREGDVRRDATHGRLPAAVHAVPVVPRARLRRRRDLRAERRAARLPAPGHDLRAADADRQDLHGQRGVRAERRRHHQR